MPIKQCLLIVQLESPLSSNIYSCNVLICFEKNYVFLLKEMRIMPLSDTTFHMAYVHGMGKINNEKLSQTGRANNLNA